MDKSPEAFRTISEVAQDLALPQHVLRFWETRFTQIKPLKRGGGRRYYRPDDIELLRSIRHLLYADGYTIKGVQRLLREHGARAVAAAAAAGSLEPPRGFVETTGSADSEPGAESTACNPATTARGAGETELEALLGAHSVLYTPAFGGDRSLAAVDRGRLLGLLADLAECERLLSAARSV